jgi:hypothetical protein
MMGLLVREALLCGSDEVSSVKVGDWWVTHSPTYWLEQEGWDKSFYTLNKYYVDGVEGLYVEIMLTAFCTDVVTAYPRGYVVFKGETSSDVEQYVEMARKTGRMIGFRPRHESAGATEERQAR